MRRYLTGWPAFLLIAPLVAGVLAHAGSGGADPPAWASPGQMALKRASSSDNEQHESNLFHNLNCSLVEYRLSGSSTMQTGCFSEAGFGMVDADSGIVIFNGTDEGVPLLPYVNGQVMVPWPAAGNLLVLSTAATGGAYVGLYKGVTAIMQEQRDLLGQLKAKQLARAPDIQLNDPAGRPLVINPATLAFSEGGSWLVAEDLNGSFVRINLATLDELPFAPAYGSSGSPALLNSAVAVSQDGRYIAINNEAAGAFKVYDLATCSGSISGLAPLNCQSYDYRAFISAQVGGLQAIRHLRFINDGLLSFEVTAKDPAKDGVYELAPAGSITSLINYLGLGDSYTSGEGASDYLSGSDSDTNHCHLSARSYPLLLSHDLFGSQGGHSVACSGAEINDVGSTSDSYRGQVEGIASWQQLEQNQPELLNSVMANFMPGFVAQQRFVKQFQPGVMTVSVGGDDVGFGTIVEQCVELHLSNNTCFNTYEDRLELKKLIDRTVPRWANLYKQLLSESPGNRLYAIGYPQIAYDEGNCALNVHLNKSELEFTTEIIDYLNGAVKQAAGKAKVPYVDISQALAGHRLCETASHNVAVNGLTAGKDAGILGIKFLAHESYHPNALGQQLIEQAILRQTNNFQAAVPPGNSAPDAAELLSKPTSGRSVATRLPTPVLTTKIVKAGQASTLKVSGGQNGLKPNTPYTVRLDGPNGLVVGTLNSDQAGDISGPVTIPGGNSGGHTIDVTGPNQTVDNVDVVQPIYIPINNNDADGDGLPDNNDSCPYVANSGQDDDQDGTDDTCDPIISQAPSSNGPISSLGNTSNNTTYQASNPTPHNKSSGQTTTKPLSTKAALSTRQGLTPSRLAKSSQPLARLPRLPKFAWLPWLLVPTISWLVILLGVIAWRSVRKIVY